MAPILIHGLGDRRYGMWSLVESVIAYLSLFDLGLAVTLVRFGARFEAQRDWRSFNRVYSTTLILFAGIGWIVFGITLVLALGWERPLGVPTDLSAEIRYLLLLLGLNMALSLPLGVYSTLFDALGQYPTKVAIRTSWTLVSAALLVTAIRSGHGLITVGLVTVACTQAENLMMAAVIHRLVPDLRFLASSVNRKSIREIWGNSAYALVAMIAGRISFQTDALVIGGFLAPQWITFFVIAARLVEYSKDAVRAFTLPFTSAFSAHEAAGDIRAIQRSFLTGTRAMLWIMAPVQAGLLTLGKCFLALWVGQDHASSSFPVLVILALPLMPFVAQIVAARVLYGLGRLSMFSIIVSSEAIVNLLGSLALIRPLGIRGVALSTTVPNLVANIFVIAMVCRLLDIRIRDYVILSWAKPTLLGAAVFIAWFSLNHIFPIDSWTSFLSVGLLGTIAYAGVALLWELGRTRIQEWARFSATPVP